MNKSKLIILFIFMCNPFVMPGQYQTIYNLANISEDLEIIDSLIINIEQPIVNSSNKIRRIENLEIISLFSPVSYFVNPELDLKTIFNGSSIHKFLNSIQDQCRIEKLFIANHLVLDYLPHKLQIEELHILSNDEEEMAILRKLEMLNNVTRFYIYSDTFLDQDYSVKKPNETNIILLDNKSSEIGQFLEYEINCQSENHFVTFYVNAYSNTNPLKTFSLDEINTYKISIKKIK